MALPTGAVCTYPLVLDPQTFLVGCGASGGPVSGILRSADGGQTWTMVSSSGGASAPLHASDGSIYWATPSKHGLTRSTDSGQHWTDVIGPGVVNSSAPIELPDGRIAALGPSGVVVSADHGSTWRAVTSGLPYDDVVGLTYSAQRKAFYTWHFTCGFNGAVPVPNDGIMRAAFDYQSN
jgi:photosystem II stability/assembly factor-like uncharacterized protein